MQIVINVSYVMLALLAIWYLYYLLSPQARSSPVWGRKKKTLKILLSYSGIRRNHTQKISEMLIEVEHLFHNGSSVDYRKMRDTLIKIKNNQTHKNKTNLNVAPQIEIIFEIIRANHKYINVASESAYLFQKLEDSLDASSIAETKKCLELLYRQSSVVEDSLRKRGKREFIVGTALGFFGLLLSVLQLIIQ